MDIKKYLVAQILSDRAIVINAGKEDRIQPGEQFVIYEIGEEIFDPATKESLGKLEIVKGQVEASEVQERLTIARTVRRTITRTKKVPDFFGVVMRGYREEEYEVDVTDRLKVAADNMIYQDKLAVKVGDLVRRLKVD